MPAMAEGTGSMAEDPFPDLCAGFLESLPISGAAISVFPGLAPETMVCASNPVAARIDELQFDLGEGPRWEALQTRRPVLLPDVRMGPHTGWPVFAKALLELDVSALFVFPLVFGALDIGSGTVQLQTRSAQPTGPLDSVASPALDDPGVAAPAPDPSEDGSDSSPLSRQEIHQATGMVLAQAGTAAPEALLLMLAHAFAQGRTVREVAHDVVSGRLDFTPRDG
jgi:hypothetical protein